MSAEGAVRNGGEARFHLIETLRFEPETGLMRRDHHFARLSRSAAALGFTCPLSEIEAALHERLRGVTEPKRVRVGLEADGKFDLQVKPFAPLAAGTIWRLRIANTRLSSTDELLRYKTSRRELYEVARAEFTPEEADEVLLLNENGEICEGAICNIFVEMEGGTLATPPLKCGLLRGVLRETLLLDGKAVEQIIYPDDLKTGGRIFVGNSLRGLIEARLVG